MLSLVAASTFCTINRTNAQNSPAPSDDPFYVGVTYCGDSVEDAKLLVDEVKNYTNLFILQSGPLQHNNSAVDMIGDYAVDCGLNFMVYLGFNSIALANNWLSTYDGRWGDRFLGVYAFDEPGGKMLDGEMSLYPEEAEGRGLIKRADSLDCYIDALAVSLTYMRNGTVRINYSDIPSPFSRVIYYQNGTIVGEIYHQNGTLTTSVLNDTSQLTYTYDELWAAYPLQTNRDAKQGYVNFVSDQVNMTRRYQNTTLNVITADYGLHWYDYESGYDAVLAQFCWNESTTQAIASVRGAANCYDKDWGAIITWKYTEAPYLASGDEIYQQMCTAYENGAKYVVVFNYAPDMQGAYGTLKEEHFEALQRFWTDEGHNSDVVRGQVKADVAFVLPQDFGSGLRKQDDTVWGLWEPTQEEQQIWSQLQNALTQYGEKLDIIYNDTSHPGDGKYSQLIYADTTPSLLTSGMLAVLIGGVTVGVLAVLFVVFRFRKNGNRNGTLDLEGNKK
jgi:hypothetical protein